MIEHLPGEIGLIALDVRGRGGSHTAPPPFDLATIADDIARSLDHFEIRDGVVAGYSMGGWIAALFAQRHPDRVARTVLVDGGFPIPADPNADADDIIEAIVGPSLARLEVTFESRDAFFDYWKAHPALQKHWDDGMRPALGYELVEWGDGFRVRINPDAVRVGAREITVEPETRNAGRRVTLPAHLIVVERGPSDEPGGMIPLDTAERAEATMPNLSKQYLAGLNHYTLILGQGAPSVATAIVG